MTDWFRSWHGAPTDPKWLTIAKRADVPAGMVSAIAWALLDYASQHADRGSIEGFDPETYADYSGFDQAKVAGVIAAMEAKRFIVDNRLKSWDKRQPSDTTQAERQARYRERLKAVRDAVSAPTVTICDDNGRDVTRDITARDVEQNRTEKNRTEKKDSRPKPAGEFELWWAECPRKVGKGQARKAFRGALKKTDLATLIAGIQRYAAQVASDGTEARFIVHPSTWLNGERWLDEPSTGPPKADFEAMRAAAAKEVFGGDGIGKTEGGPSDPDPNAGAVSAAA